MLEIVPGDIINLSIFMIDQIFHIYTGIACKIQSMSAKYIVTIRITRKVKLDKSTSDGRKYSPSSGITVL